MYIRRLLSLSAYSLFYILFSTSCVLPVEPTVVSQLARPESARQCSQIPELCGDGVDQNCDGKDALCPGDDQDGDGVFSFQDCDDTNKRIYPGISISCSASCGSGIRTCQSDGTFSECSCNTLCEATGSGRCYYISATQGSDSNPGTFSSPLKTALPLSFFYYNSKSPRPPQSFKLKAGDVVYFMDGIYSATVEYSNAYYSIFLDKVHGTKSHPVILKNYPGSSAVIVPYRNRNESPKIQTIGMLIQNSSNIILEGFEIRDAFGKGLIISHSDYIELRNFWIHETDGVDNTNLSAIYFDGTTNSRVHNSILHDNYDRTNADTNGQKTQNSRNIVLFRGGNIRIDHNAIFQTPPTSASKTGGCLTYKHASDLPNSVFEVDNNTFWNCFFHAVGSGSAGDRIHHNLIINSDFSIIHKDFGGPADMKNKVVEKNTIIGGGGMSLFMHSQDGIIEDITFRNNIVIDNRKYDISRGGIIQVSPYGKDNYYDMVVDGGQLHIEDNCYYNTKFPVRFGLFSVNQLADAKKGGLYSIGEWQRFGYDTGSFVTDPQLDEFFKPKNAKCQAFGRDQM